MSLARDFESEFGDAPTPLGISIQAVTHLAGVLKRVSASGPEWETLGDHREVGYTLLPVLYALREATNGVISGIESELGEYL